MPSLLLRWHSASTQVQHLFVCWCVHAGFAHPSGCIWVTCHRRMLCDMKFLVPPSQRGSSLTLMPSSCLATWMSICSWRGRPYRRTEGVCLNHTCFNFNSTLKAETVYQEKIKRQKMYKNHSLVHLCIQITFISYNSVSSELLICFSPCPRQKSWLLLWAAMAVPCGNTQLSYYYAV